MADKALTAIFVKKETRDELKKLASSEGRTMMGQIETWVKKGWLKKRKLELTP